MNRTLEFVIILILILYVLGLVTPIGASLGGLVHLLLVILLVVIVIRVLQGRNPLP